MNNIDKFLEIESKFKLYTDLIDGVNYWNYIRFTLFNYDIMEKYLGLTQKTSTSRKTTIKELCIMGMQYVKSQLSLLDHKTHKDVMFIVHPRRVLLHGKYESIYTDNLEEQFDSSISVEIPKIYMHPKDIKTKNLVYLFDGLLEFYMGKIFRDITQKKKTSALIEEVREHLSQPFGEINEAYGIKLDIDYWTRDVVDRIYKVQYFRKAMRKLIDRYTPRVIVELVYYDTYNMALNEVAREMNIPIIELQHGTMHSDHAGYQYATEAELQQLPNVILTYSEYWNEIAHLPEKCTQLIATGFPYFEKCVEELRQKNQRTDQRVTIVFVSQETIGPALAKLAAELARNLSEKQYRIFYKLHPGECTGWKKKYPFLLETNLEVIDRSELSIYELFAISDIQVGAYSTALYEGLGYGLKTFIYKIGHSNTLEPLVQRGFAEYIDCASELKKAIEDFRHDDTDGKTFWKLNALKNVCNEIERIGGLK